MLSIGEMAKLCHLSVQTIQLYDQKGLINAAYVDPATHYRYYQTSQIFQFNLVKYLQDTNLSLKEIKEVFSDDSVNLIDFWQRQQQTIQQQITEEQRKLVLARFQQTQLQTILEMKEHLNQGPYIKEISKQIAVIPTTRKLSPASIPDKAVAKLNQALVKADQIPNLEYGFSFAAQDYSRVEDIKYRSIFKELILPLNSSTQFRVQDVSGTYLCINFRWSVERYNDYLKKLLSAAEPGPHLGIVYEESWPLNYLTTELASGQNSIAELRIKI